MRPGRGPGQALPGGKEGSGRRSSCGRVQAAPEGAVKPGRACAGGSRVLRALPGDVSGHRLHRRPRRPRVIYDPPPPPWRQRRRLRPRPSGGGPRAGGTASSDCAARDARAGVGAGSRRLEEELWPQTPRALPAVRHRRERLQRHRAVSVASDSRLRSAEEPVRPGTRPRRRWTGGRK